MIPVADRIKASPVFVRVVPFGIFLLLTLGQEWFGPTGQYWLYLGKMVIGALMIVWIWPAIEEMRWKFSMAGVAMGIIAFVIWIGVDDVFQAFGINPGFGEIK